MQPRTEQPPGGRDFVPLMCRLSSVEPQPLPWLWPGRIPVGKLTLLAGDPGVGKSLLTIDMAARITAGRPWPDQPDNQLPEPGDVIYIGTEDDMADTLRPRLEAAGGDPSRFYVLTGCADPHKDGWHPLKLPRDRIVVYQMGRALPATKLIIIDPLAGFLADSDAHTPMRIRGVLRTLMEEMDTFGMAVVAITHLSKSGPRPPRPVPLGRFPLVRRHRPRRPPGCPDPEDPGRRLMLPLKNNLAGESFGLAFRIDGPRIVWEDGAVTTTADEALVAPQDGPTAAPRSRSGWANCSPPGR